jgi:hypothetical protein
MSHLGIFKFKFGQKREHLKELTVEAALAELEAAAIKHVKEARWANYGGKVKTLQRALLQVKLARRKAKV